MKNMKNLLLVSVFALVFFMGVKPANAMTEQELKNKLEQTYVINGEKFKLSNDNKVLLERYLNQYEISEADADYIAARVDEAVAIIENSGKTNLNDLAQSTKDELKAIVEKVTANTSVTATVVNGNVVVYKPDGTGVFAEVDKLVKNTDTDNNLTLVVGLSAGIVLISMVSLVKKSKLVKNA